MRLWLIFFPKLWTNSIIFKEFFKIPNNIYFKGKNQVPEFLILRDWTGCITKKILRVELTTKRDIKCEPSNIKDTGPMLSIHERADILTSIVPPTPSYWYSLEGIKYHCYRGTSSKWFDWTRNKMFFFLFLITKQVDHIISKSYS